MVLKLNLTRSTKNGNIQTPTPNHTKRQCLCSAVTVFGAAARQGIVALWPAGPVLFLNFWLYVIVLFSLRTACVMYYRIQMFDASVQ